MNEYDDIINLPHHQSKSHPHMTMYNRAAQFAPFAALRGHGAALSATEDGHKVANESLYVDDEQLI